MRLDPEILREKLSAASALADNTGVHILGILLISFTAWWLYSLFVRLIEKKYRTSPLFETNGHLMILARKAGHWLILLVAAIGVVKIVNLPWLEKYIHAAIIMLAAWFANAVLKRLIPLLRRSISTKTNTRLDDMFLDLLSKFSGVILYTVGIILAFDAVGLNVMPFIAGAGVAGIAIGFAAKDTLSNLIAGVLLMIDRPFEVGDRIEVWSAPSNSATWGDIIDIGLRATKIRTTDNIVIIIPNNEIMKRDIINYTAITDHIRVRIPIGIAYDANIDKAKEAVIRVAQEMEWALIDPPPAVVVKNFGESSVDLEARVWIKEARRRIHTISYMTDRLKHVFDEEGIEIPYPKRDVYVRKVN